MKLVKEIKLINYDKKIIYCLTYLLSFCFFFLKYPFLHNLTHNSIARNLYRTRKYLNISPLLLSCNINEYSFFTKIDFSFSLEPPKLISYSYMVKVMCLAKLLKVLIQMQKFDCIDFFIWLKWDIELSISTNSCIPLYGIQSKVKGLHRQALGANVLKLL